MNRTGSFHSSFATYCLLCCGCVLYSRKRARDQNQEPNACGIAPHTVPGTVREFALGRGARGETPKKDPKCLTIHRPRQWPEMRPHHAAWRSLRTAAGPEGPFPQLQCLRTSVHGLHGQLTVRSRGPVMGCIACAAAHPDEAPRGVQYHMQQASRRTVCLSLARQARVGVESVRSVSERHQERCPGAPVPVGMDVRPDRG